MYKVGDKFIIEIGSEYTENTFEDGKNGKRPTILYRIKDFNFLTFDENGLNRLTSYNEEFDNNEEVIADAEKYGYDKGLSDAWEFWKKLQNIDIREDGASVAKNIFDCRDMVEVLKKYSPQETIEKLKAWETFQEIKKQCEGCSAWDGCDCSRMQEEDCLKKREIKAGDIVKITGDEILVTAVNGDFFDGVFVQEKHETVTNEPVGKYHKTGKHIDLTEIFKGLEGEDAD